MSSLHMVSCYMEWLPSVSSLDCRTVGCHMARLYDKFLSWVWSEFPVASEITVLKVGCTWSCCTASICHQGVREAVAQ